MADDGEGGELEDNLERLEGAVESGRPHAATAHHPRLIDVDAVGCLEDSDL